MGIKKCKFEEITPFGMIIFGGTGDLSNRKLYPALYNLYQNKILSKNFFIVGVGRRKFNDNSFRKRVAKSINKNENHFLKNFYYLKGNINDINFYTNLENKIYEINKEYNTLIFYFATYPTLYKSLIDNIKLSGITKNLNKNFENIRFVVEKPYGYDLQSAIELDKSFHKYVKENQIYRIDHYLGKETVQNILMFRFANLIFEPIWSNKYIDNIQITVSEKLGVEERAGYFDKAGLLRDMFQNHIMQMIALIAMEPPISFNADDIRNEKVKLMRSIKKFKPSELHKYFIRSQYISGKIDNKRVVGYKEEDAIPENSTTETYIATKLFIKNWRWAGVPFYIRAGKRLKKKSTYIVVNFKPEMRSMFKNINLESNRLIIKVQPDEGFQLEIAAKIPGSKLCLTKIPLSFSYNKYFKQKLPDAYQRLLIDIILGDQTLFWRSDGIRVSWELINPVLEAWKTNKMCILCSYKAGTWGPVEADEFIKKDNRDWVNI